MKIIALFTFLITNLSFGQTLQNSIVYLSQEENQLYGAINQLREQLGLPLLQIHTLLQNTAKKHSEWMANQDLLTHFGPTQKNTAFDRMHAEGYQNYTIAGENLARGASDGIQTFRALAFSPEHLENMINPHYHHFGISRAYTSQGNSHYYWANEFGSISDLTSDPLPVTDLKKIRAAIEKVSGPIPLQQKVELPNAVQSNPRLLYSFIECTIPYSIGKNIIPLQVNTTLVISFTKKSATMYQASVTYLQNGLLTGENDLYLPEVSIVENYNLPLLVIFSRSSTQMNDFMIQINKENTASQLNSIPDGTGGAVLCSYKM